MILFVGQAPSKASEGKPAFSGVSGKRLASLMGIDKDEMLRIHKFVNVFEHFPGKGDSNHPRGDAFPMKEAREKVQVEIVPLLKHFDHVVLVGKNVRDAFRLDCEYFDWVVYSQDRWETRLVVVPHPSGVSHWWNSGHNRNEAAEFFNREPFKRRNAWPETLTANSTRRISASTRLKNAA